MTRVATVAGQTVELPDLATVYCDRCGDSWVMPEKHADGFAEAHVEGGPCGWGNVGVWSGDQR